ncbi:uncharacterized protein EV420DRAFT_117255 [Desarmillaria tabescens]|uniref:Uncharacterized protein n=1 Tax=Armillaria tabescens TaxID=1929756 RepID=A0AA39NRR2_ARMTA|nr:uncharacterized protein EV420DRAFT_117255 [Desarmillaria tabescens]KAK0470480.1 hypothetical protein EV420DRAFT_117255 [Desarmillaria tabescens]
MPGIDLADQEGCVGLLSMQVLILVAIHSFLVIFRCGISHVPAFLDFLPVRFIRVKPSADIELRPCFVVFLSSTNVYHPAIVVVTLICRRIVKIRYHIEYIFVI